MRTQIVFVNFDRTEALEDISREKLQSVLDKFGEENFVTAVMRLRVDNSAQQPGRDVFTCEIQIGIPAGRDVLMKKSAMNMYDAINWTCDKLSYQLSKLHKRRMSHHDKHRRAERFFQ